MNFKIVSDSSSNILTLSAVDYAAVSLKIITESKEYVDDCKLNVKQMTEELYNNKGKSSTSCPNMQEWMDAFGDGNDVFAVTITSKLSGSYSSAVQAREEYIKKYPNAKAYVIDTLSAGPAMQLVIEKLEECALNGIDFDKTEEIIEEYQKHVNLSVSLQSLMNLARNGRTSLAVAKIAGVLGIRIVGAAIDGELKPLHKCRGEKKALQTVKSELVKNGFNGGKVRIAHCFNEESANELKSMLLADFPNGDIEVSTCSGLCSYYAEKGGLMIGFEN